MLEDKRQEIYLCIRCNFCRDFFADAEISGSFKSGYSNCPIWEKYGFEGYTAKGKLEYARAVSEGKLKYEPSFIDSVYTCLVCGNCKEHCPCEIDIVGVTKAVRADIYSAGFKIPEGIERLADAIERTHNIFGANSEDMNRWITPDIKIEKKAEIAYFPGCIASFRFPEIAQATARILNKADVKFTTLGSEAWCCGDPLFLTGLLALTKEIAQHNVEKLKEIGATTVVTSCAGCYRCLKEEYPEALRKDPGLEIIHTSEFIANLIDSGKIKLKKKIEEKITYHDPCELGRHMGVYDPPRKVIESIPGVKLVETLRNRENAWCCGAGGGVKASNPGLSVEICQDKLQEVLDTGAEIIVSACPTCEWNIADAIEASNSNLRILDITELVANSMGL